MTQPHGATPDGTLADLIGQPLHPGRGSVPGVVVRRSETMETAERGGVYVLNGYRYRIRKGDPLPEGAVMWGGPDHPDLIEHGIQKADKAEKTADDSDETPDEPNAEVSEAPAKRKRGAAPENRAKADEAETR